MLTVFESFAELKEENHRIINKRRYIKINSWNEFRQKKLRNMYLHVLRVYLKFPNFLNFQVEDHSLLPLKGTLAQYSKG